MKLIAHRGLTEGPNDDLENNPIQIEFALSLGFYAEVDLWEIQNRWFLGHDGPRYEVSWDFINNSQLWLHCKTAETLLALRSRTQLLRYFYHDTDLIVQTSYGDIWTYFGDPKTASKFSICVMPEATRSWEAIAAEAKNGTWGGFCTDWPIKLKTLLK